MVCVLWYEIFTAFLGLLYKWQWYMIHFGICRFTGLLGLHGLPYKWQCYMIHLGIYRFTGLFGLHGLLYKWQLYMIHLGLLGYYIKDIDKYLA